MTKSEKAVIAAAISWYKVQPDRETAEKRLKTAVYILEVKRRRK